MRERVEGRKTTDRPERGVTRESLQEWGWGTDRETNTDTGKRKPETETREISDKYNERMRDREYQRKKENKSTRVEK